MRAIQQSKEQIKNTASVYAGKDQVHKKMIPISSLVERTLNIVFILTESENRESIKKAWSASFFFSLFLPAL